MAGGSHTLPRNYKSPPVSPLGSPPNTREPVIDLPVSYGIYSMYRVTSVKILRDANNNIDGDH